MPLLKKRKKNDLFIQIECIDKELIIFGALFEKSKKIKSNDYVETFERLYRMSKI